MPFIFFGFRKYAEIFRVKIRFEKTVEENDEKVNLSSQFSLFF